MAGRPSIQFYFGDWKKNKKLRFCSWGARGAWIEVMGLMHDSEESTEYGVLRKPLRAIAQAIGAPPRLVQELATNGVMRGCEKGMCLPLIYQPKHGRTLGAPVTLIEAQQGPIWYSARMVIDEYVRLRRGDSSRFADGNGGAPIPPFGDDLGAPPNRSPNGAEGDGASTSSSSSSSYSSFASGLSEAEQTARALAVVNACKALRRLGMLDVQPGRPELLDLIARGATTEQMAMTAAEITLREARKAQAKCLMGLDPEPHPELLELFASGATAEQMYLRPAELAELKTYTPKLKYLAATLIGRAKDQQGQEDNHGDQGNRRTAGTPAGTVRESASARAERKRREGDARDAAAAGEAPDDGDDPA